MRQLPIDPQIEHGREKVGGDWADISGCSEQVVGEGSTDGTFIFIFQPEQFDE